MPPDRAADRRDVHPDRVVHLEPRGPRQPQRRLEDVVLVAVAVVADAPEHATRDAAQQVGAIAVGPAAGEPDAADSLRLTRRIVGMPALARYRPREIKPGRPIRDEGAKAALRPFATALRGFLGAGSLTLQGAGTKLRAVPGFSEAMVEQKITGIGAFLRFLNLFPEFVVEGKAPKASVRLK